MIRVVGEEIGRIHPILAVREFRDLRDTSIALAGSTTDSFIWTKMREVDVLLAAGGDVDILESALRGTSAPALAAAS